MAGNGLNIVLIIAGVLGVLLVIPGILLVIFALGKRHKPEPKSGRRAPRKRSR
jgi:uncharacterized membrane protein HdeD (DUF308 family)